jgi:transcriptional regulator with XRE-family HTH domain
MKVRLKVKELATAHGFNQSTLSRAANVDFKTIQRLFRDPYRDVSISTVVKIAWALNIPLADLIEVSGLPTSRWNEEEEKDSEE